ncbi:MAG: hypothetical protein AB1349_14450 [Elusimicrobiota bacterium]
MKKLFWSSLILGVLSFGLFVFVFIFCQPVIKTDAQNFFRSIEEHQIINKQCISTENQDAYNDLKQKLIISELRLKKTSWLLYFLSSVGFLIFSLSLFVISFALRRHNHQAQRTARAGAFLNNREE